MVIKNQSILLMTLIFTSCWLFSSIVLAGEDIQIVNEYEVQRSVENSSTSFDCEKAKNNRIEKIICTNEELAKLDIKLSEIYHSFSFLSQEIKSDQRAWLKKRNTCKDEKCIKQAYLMRIEELNQALSNQKTFPKFILSAMQKAEKDMQPEWVKFPPVFPEDEKYKQQGVEFKSELFRFQNLRFKSPLVENVPYDDEQLKAVLGACAKYSFNKDIYAYSQSYSSKYGREDFRFFYGRGTGDFYAHQAFTVWDVTTKGEQWLLIKEVTDSSLTGSYPYLVRPELCAQDSNHDLVVALTNGTVKKAVAPFKSLRVVEYKNKDYLFETYLYLAPPHRRVGFHINQVLTDDMVVGRKFASGDAPTRQEKYRQKDGWLYDLWFFQNK